MKRVFLGLGLLCLGGLVGLTPLYAGKPGGGTPLPRVIAYSAVNKSGCGSYDVRVMDVNGGNRATVASNIWPGSDTPRWSPDGQRLLFAHDINGVHSVVSTTANGSDKQVIVDATDIKNFAASIGRTAGSRFRSWDWSPDGTAIVCSFVIDIAAGISAGNNRLFVIDVTGGTITQLTDFEADEPTSDFGHVAARWSRSLNAISYVRVYYANGEPGTPLPELWVVSADGVDQRFLATLEPAYNAANWSNSGDSETLESGLAFSVSGGIVVADVDLDAVNPIIGSMLITNSSAELSAPDWSPDDTQLVLRRRTSSTDQIITRDLFTGSQKTLIEVSASKASVRDPAWAPRP